MTGLPAARDTTRGRRATALPVPAFKARKAWRFVSSDATAARAMRHEITQFVRDLAADDQSLFAAELVLAEILADAVYHAPALVLIEIDWTDEELTITGLDRGSALSAERDASPEAPLGEGGRGIALIRAVARNVEVSLGGRYGTYVRVVLDMRRRSA